MIYKTFKLSDEKGINTFIKENKENISKNGILFFPDRVGVLVSDPFDPESHTREVQKSYWKKQREDVLAQLADNLIYNEMWKDAEPDSIVYYDEKEYGGMKGRSGKTAKDALAELATDRIVIVRKIVVLDKLIMGAPMEVNFKEAKKNETKNEN